ncbi:hypothetical protein P7K49_015027 [Saguinus oedipus]|uniref:Uncharacterized protein n=1 Tax=Saguinus oedipus TaxID=9490 RepID=A0ABQ9V825_SAGOE|nr:hypothetical protein P7K49_015027 [Saguinus oedipus]
MSEAKCTEEQDCWDERCATKKGSSCLRGRGAGGGEGRKQLHPKVQRQAEDGVSTNCIGGKVNLPESENEAPPETMEDGNGNNSHCVEIKKKRRKFVSAKVSPIEQFNKHSLHPSCMPHLKPGNQVKGMNEMCFDRGCPARSSESEERQSMWQMSEQRYSQDATGPWK